MKKPNSIKRQFISTVLYFTIGGTILWGIGQIWNHLPKSAATLRAERQEAEEQRKRQEEWERRAAIEREEREARELEQYQNVLAQAPDVQCLIRHEYRPYMEYGQHHVDDYSHVEVYSLRKQFRVKFVSDRNSTKMNEDNIGVIGNIYPAAAKALKRYAEECLEKEQERIAERKRQNPPVGIY